MNRYPYNNGHLMVVPYRHTGDFSKLTQEELCELMELTKQTFIILNKVLKPHGYNAGFNLIFQPAIDFLIGQAEFAFQGI